MILLYLRPGPKSCQFYVSGVSPVPCDFVDIIAPAVCVTIAHLPSASGILPLGFCRQSVTICSGINGYSPFDLVEIAKLWISQVIRIILSLDYVVVRTKPFLVAPFIAILNGVIPIHHLY